MLSWIWQPVSIRMDLIGGSMYVCISPSQRSWLRSKASAFDQFQHLFLPETRFVACLVSLIRTRSVCTATRRTPQLQLSSSSAASQGHLLSRLDMTISTASWTNTGSFSRWRSRSIDKHTCSSVQMKPCSLCKIFGLLNVPLSPCEIQHNVHIWL